MSKVTLRQIWRTLISDLIGKDSHRGITLTYGWMANQVGHFALGFIPVAILILMGGELVSSTLWVCLFWLAFEIVNALSPLYKKEYKGNGTFKPDWKNLTFDTFTDLCFFWIGSLTFYFLAAGIDEFFYLFLAGVACLSLAIRYWFLTKLYQQNAFFPFPFRLSQWNKYLVETDRSVVLDIVRDPEKSLHVLVFGEKNSGKTALSVGLANELAIKHVKVIYTTFNKWVNSMTHNTHSIDSGKIGLWSWLDSRLLVIDDVNPGYPCAMNLVTTSTLLANLKKYEFERNVHFFQQHSVIWVIGACAPGETPDDWVHFLQEVGIESEKIVVLNLGQEIKKCS